jgi:flavin-dependent dehydrogenase
MREVDVIVLGAGISGSTAAALLRKKGYSVALVTRDCGTRYHLPESWVYKPSSCFSDLNIEGKIISSLRKQSFCTFSSSDNHYSTKFSIKSRKPIKQGEVAWVDRDHLDQILFNCALDLGTIVYPLSRILNCVLSLNEATISIETDNEQTEIKAKHIIDATGKTAFLTHHLNLKREEKKLDSRIAYFSHFKVPFKKYKEMHIVYIKGGYLFCIPLADQRLSIGCVLSEDSQNSISSPEEVLISSINSTYLGKLIAQSKKILPTLVAKNSQSICLEPAGLRYRLVGDAAAFLDPFFSPGIDFAFFSAEKAAKSIELLDPFSYEASLREWINNSQLSVYEKIDKSTWKEILRLFADPHLPFIVPLLLTQAFCQINGVKPSLNNGILLARRAYEMEIC